MTVVLMIVTIVATVALAWTLVHFMTAITDRLDSIGTGPSSSLAMIAWGVRAIESETSAIPNEVPRLNEQLSAAAGVLGRIDDGLVAIAGSAAAQEAYR